MKEGTLKVILRAFDENGIKDWGRVKCCLISDLQNSMNIAVIHNDKEQWKYTKFQIRALKFCFAETEF